jgi:hypothetical protein
VRRIVIIGVHGWAPLGGALSDAQKLNTQKFCVLATAAIRRMLAVLREEASLSSSAAAMGTSRAAPDIDIFPIALAVHGTIDFRVHDYLETQLPPFFSQIRAADLVFVACHSQGCAVAALVLERLMANGIVDAGGESQVRVEGCDSSLSSSGGRSSIPRTPSLRDSISRTFSASCSFFAFFFSTFAVGVHAGLERRTSRSVPRHAVRHVGGDPRTV